MSEKPWQPLIDRWKRPKPSLQGWNMTITHIATGNVLHIEADADGRFPKVSAREDGEFKVEPPTSRE